MKKKQAKIKFMQRISKEIEINVPSKYYKRFEYSYKRDCFRAMTEYLKFLFKPYRTAW